MDQLQKRRQKGRPKRGNALSMLWKARSPNSDVEEKMKNYKKKHQITQKREMKLVGLEAGCKHAAAAHTQRH